VQERRSTLLAFLAALALHVLLLIVTWDLDLFRPLTEKEVVAVREQTVEVVLEPEPDVPALPAITLPTAYTSVPERQQAEEPPAVPDFLALRDSRAADRIAGGEPESSPRADRAGEFPQVAILPDVGGGQPADARVLATPEGGGGRPDGDRDAEGEQVLRGRDLPQTPDGATASGGESDRTQQPRRGEGERPAAPDLVEVPVTGAVSVLDDRRGDPGDRGFEYRQDAFSPVAGNLIQFGDFQLSTVEWDFAPWLESFKRAFLPNWIPPYAYHLGVIDGWTIVKLVVQPDGVVSGMEVVEKQGHASLHQASVAALRATAPLKPLPEHFPDPELVLTVKLHYSARDELPPAGSRR
jgi:outer membrane biosynthesis protein TonB